MKYVDLHRATSENNYLYEGAFATGVRRVKVHISSTKIEFLQSAANSFTA